MELRHVNSFIAVAEELNFSRAARRLGLSQPPLSRQIQALEHTLGVALFERGKGRVRLTKCGEAALNEAYRLIEQSERMQHAARRAAPPEGARLTIGYLPSAFSSSLTHLLERFRANHSEVEVSLTELDVADAIQLLRNYLIDAAVIRIAERTEPLRSLPLCPERCCVALPDSHPLAGEDVLRLADIGREILVVPSRRVRPGYFNAILVAFEKAGIRPRFAHEALTISSLLAVVASGIAISLIPRSLHDAPVPGVTFVPLAEVVRIVEMSVVWNGNSPSQLVNDFVDAAQTLVKVT